MLSKNKTIFFVGLFFFSNISYTSVTDDDKVTCSDFLRYAGFCCLGCCVYWAETHKSGVAIKEFVGAQQVLDKAHKPLVIDNNNAALNEPKEYKKKN